MMLRTIRQSKGLSQMQLAQQSGVNIRQIQRIENGESDIGNVTLKNALAIAAALEIDVSDLMLDECEDGE